jgi:hypothetical protein
VPLEVRASYCLNFEERWRQRRAQSEQTGAVRDSVAKKHSLVKNGAQLHALHRGEDCQYAANLSSARRGQVVDSMIEFFRFACRSLNQDDVVRSGKKFEPQSRLDVNALSTQ